LKKKVERKLKLSRWFKNQTGINILRNTCIKYYKTIVMIIILSSDTCLCVLACSDMRRRMLIYRSEQLERLLCVLCASLQWTGADATMHLQVYSTRWLRGAIAVTTTAAAAAAAAAIGITVRLRHKLGATTLTDRTNYR